MEIVLLAVGSRGDIQPLIALGCGLQKEQFKVTIATHLNFESMITAKNLGFKPLNCDPREALGSEQGLRWLESGNNPLRFYLSFKKLIDIFIDEIAFDAWQACQGADVIIYSAFAIVGYHIAEKLKVPSFAAHFVPLHPTGAFPSALIPTRKNWGKAYNFLTHMLVARFYVGLYRKPCNVWRKKLLELTPLPLTTSIFKQKKKAVPFLYCFSPRLVPRAYRKKKHIAITGYWYLHRDKDWLPPEELENFLHKGPPPVYIGFGSLSQRDPEAKTQQLIQALRTTGNRGIINIGWGALASRQHSGAEDIYFVQDIPHDYLFPRMAGVIHHGGAGTTAACLLAGVPMLTMPFFADQFFWGQRAYRSGLGPPPLPVHTATLPGLVKAIRELTETGLFTQRAAQLAKKIRKEEGVAVAVEFIRNYLSR